MILSDAVVFDAMKTVMREAALSVGGSASAAALDVQFLRINGNSLLTVTDTAITFSFSCNDCVFFFLVKVTG